MPDRILIVANKSFEVEPLVGVLANNVASPSTSSRRVQVFATAPSGGPRAKVFLGSGDIAEVWCIQDLMDRRKSASSSEEKVRVLPFVLAGADLRASVRALIAFGTAASPGTVSRNGCVSLGSSVFIHNHYALGTPNPESGWQDPGNTGRIIASSAGEQLLARLASSSAYFDEVRRRLLAPASAPAATLEVTADANAVAVSSVNITNYALYKTVDPQALAAAVDKGVAAIASLETTHGLIRLASEGVAPFLFVSGITNRVGQFSEENVFYKQNLVASHNAAIALSWALDTLFG